ncbi:MAG: ABC transporter permease [Planctomycetota bacterium]|nr:ABC transporter permease [Planctomycetota bacterium]
MPRLLQKLFHGQFAGLALVIVALGAGVALYAGPLRDPFTGAERNRLLNAHTLLDTATNASFFAIMAVGATMVIVSGGIDLSVGATYALAGVGGALVFRALEAQAWPPAAAVLCGLLLGAGIGFACGLLNGLLIVGLNIHPFIVTLGTMWLYRGIASVVSESSTILVGQALTEATKSSLGLSGSLRPVPLLAMLLVTLLGALYLNKTVWGRHVYAVGGNAEAARFAGLRIGRVKLAVYALSGLTAGLAAFLGSSYYGGASSADGDGYELFVIASAVVGGVSLSGGRGGVFGALLGAVLIALLRQSIVILNYRSQYEWIIVGAAIIIAAYLDQLKLRLSARRLAEHAVAARVSGAAKETESGT